MKHHRIVMALLLAFCAGSAAAAEGSSRSNEGESLWKEVSQAIVLSFERFSAKANSIWVPPTKTKGGLDLSNSEEPTQESQTSMELGRLFPL